MNEMLQKYALIAEIISALSIVFSLIYVGIQIRQNTSATNGSTIQEISNQSLNLAMMGVENRDLRLAWERSTRGVEYMTTEDISILTWMYLAVIRIAENRFRQMQLGTIKTSAENMLAGALQFTKILILKYGGKQQR